MTIKTTVDPVESSTEARCVSRRTVLSATFGANGLMGDFRRAGHWLGLLVRLTLASLGRRYEAGIFCNWARVCDRRCAYVELVGVIGWLIVMV